MTDMEESEEEALLREEERQEATPLTTSGIQSTESGNAIFSNDVIPPQVDLRGEQNKLPLLDLSTALYKGL